MQHGKYNYLENTLLFFVFFFNATATTEIYTLSLHDALPILNTGLEIIRVSSVNLSCNTERNARTSRDLNGTIHPDRKSTRLNSSHVEISYAVFCLKKKKL